MVCADILDHDAQVGGMMVNTVLGQLRARPDVDWQAIQHLLLVADCGPHFRSKENVAHFCVTLPKKLGFSVEICWLGEQHGKSGVDRCFGWCNQWITEYIHVSPIHGLADLIKCFESGASHMMKEDPEAATIAVVKFRAGTERPSPRLIFACDGFKVSRTYSMVGSLTPYSSAGVRVVNKIFSDLASGDTLTWTIQEVTPTEGWRVGYYDKARPWEEPGPQAGQANSITRRFADQKTAKHANMPSRRPSFLETCSSKALSLKRASAKKRRKLKQLRGPRAESHESGTSSSSSSSSSSDSVSSAG